MSVCDVVISWATEHILFKTDIFKNAIDLFGTGNSVLFFCKFFHKSFFF